MNWRRFTHRQLSMIASHLAGGGTFCDRLKTCAPEGRQALATVSSSRRLRDDLGEHASEDWGCGWGTDRASHYLEKFLSQI